MALAASKDPPSCVSARCTNSGPLARKRTLTKMGAELEERRAEEGVSLSVLQASSSLRAPAMQMPVLLSRVGPSEKEKKKKRL